MCRPRVYIPNPSAGLATKRTHLSMPTKGTARAWSCGNKDLVMISRCEKREAIHQKKTAGCPSLALSLSVFLPPTQRGWYIVFSMSVCDLVCLFVCLFVCQHDNSRTFRVISRNFQGIILLLKGGKVIKKVCASGDLTSLVFYIGSNSNFKMKLFSAYSLFSLFLLLFFVFVFIAACCS